MSLQYLKYSTNQSHEIGHELLYFVLKRHKNNKIKTILELTWDFVESLHKIHVNLQERQAEMTVGTHMEAKNLVQLISVGLLRVERLNWPAQT